METRIPTRDVEEGRLIGVYDALLEEHMPPSFLVDENRALLQSFAGASRYLRVHDGRLSTDLVGMFDAEPHMALAEALQRAWKETAPVLYQGLRVQTVDGEQLVNLSVKPIRDRRSGRQYALVSLEQLAATQNCEAPQQGDRLLEHLSHELRNPLSAILNATQLFRLGVEAGPEASELYELIDRQAHLMVRLLDAHLHGSSNRPSDNEPETRDQSKPKSTRVLIVEDNPDSRETLAALLEMDGFEVVAKETGSEALEAIRSHQPDVALIDIGLPGLDGYQVAEQIRKERQNDRLRLIALTGYGRPEDCERVRAAGFDAHLVKPVRVETLYPHLTPRDVERRSLAATGRFAVIHGKFLAVDIRPPHR